MRVITFSTKFPAKHPRKGEPTFFVEQIYNAIGFRIGTTKASGDIPPAMWNKVNDFVLLDGEHKKYHTIRAGERWKVGDWFSPRIWSGKPYASKQIEFAPPIQIKKIWGFEIEVDGDYICILIDNKPYAEINKELTTDSGQLEYLANNDGLSKVDMLDWFNIHPMKQSKAFKGQILCWNEAIEYV